MHHRRVCLCVLAKQCLRSNGAKTKLARATQERAPGLGLKEIELRVHQRFISVSSKLSRTLATLVHAARSGRSAPAGAAPMGLVASAVA